MHKPLIALLAALLAAPANADTLIHNANGIQVGADGKLQRFEALLIGDDGKVVQTFTKVENPAHTGPRIDAGGRTLLPGLIDAHGHVKEPGQLTRAIIAKLVSDILLVPERDLERAVALLVAIEKSVVEGAGAAGLAALLAHPQRFAGKRVGVVLCGGNIDTHLLANVLVRDLVRCGRIARLRIEAQDRPGALAAITAQFHDCGVNIIETNHHRIFTRLPAKDTVIEVECEARDAQAIDGLVAKLEGVGFHVHRASLD